MTKDDFLQVFDLLQLNYNKKVNEKIIDIWYEEFKSMSKDNFEKCIIKCIKEEKTFPTINKLVNYDYLY